MGNFADTLERLRSAASQGQQGRRNEILIKQNDLRKVLDRFDKLDEDARRDDAYVQSLRAELENLRQFQIPALQARIAQLEAEREPPTRTATNLDDADIPPLVTMAGFVSLITKQER